MDDLMNGESSKASRPYASFLTLAVGILVALVAVGLVPTRLLAGDGALASMVAGCAISFAAALFGTVPVLLARGRSAAETVPAVMLSMALRLGAAILISLAVVWSGWFEAPTLLVWMVLSHAALQVAEFKLAKQVLYAKPAYEAVVHQ